MRSHVFKHSYAMAVKSRKVPLEIFSNPTILSDDNLFSEFFDFFTPSPLGRGEAGEFTKFYVSPPTSSKSRSTAFSVAASVTTWTPAERRISQVSS